MIKAEAKRRNEERGELDAMQKNKGEQSIALKREVRVSHQLHEFFCLWCVRLAKPFCYSSQRGLD